MANSHQLEWRQTHPKEIKRTLFAGGLMAYKALAPPKPRARHGAAAEQNPRQHEIRSSPDRAAVLRDTKSTARV